jgi:uncharacterized membrane protein
MTDSRVHDQQKSPLAGDAIVCPACGGENPADAIFCANPACHKALGEFDYILEEFDAARGWIEHLADRVTSFAGRPHFVTLHLAWFAIWVMANSGLIVSLQGFDEYPFALLSFILAIEAILMTGFLLISQNRQQAYSEKRAELDYEVNIRSYRKLIDLEKRMDALLKVHASGDAEAPPSSSG